MDSIEINKLINRIQKDLIDQGMDSEKIIPNLREVRSLFSAAKEPRLTRMVRMTIEHIEENDTFLIDMPNEEEEEEGVELEAETEEVVEEAAESDTEEAVEEEEAEEEIEAEDDITDLEKQIASLDYMLQLMTKPTNKFNAVELNLYFKALVADSKQ